MRICPRCGSRYQHERFCPEDGAATAPLPAAGPPTDALIGSVVAGRYRIEAQIGEGGMGVVYRARHTALNKVLALKVLRGEMAKQADVVQRFIQEAQAATSIGHENIIDISDFGRLPDGTVYFVMEYLDGRPLKELIERGGSLPVVEAVDILRQIASALGAAHRRGIVHRDLKPDNVMVLSRGELQNFVKVLDFGIAKVGTTKNKLTRTGMVFGTPHYMSPEQAAGQVVDSRTDIYALGVIMYEMFAGRVPFDADTFMAVLTKHMFEKPAPMFGAGSSRQLGALEQITMRALEKKPEDRYATMDDLIADLERVLGGELPRPPSDKRPSLALADALEPRSKTELRIAETGSKPALPVERRWPLFVAGGAGLVATIALAALLIGRDDAPRGRASEPPLLPSIPATGAGTAARPAQPSPEIALESTPSGAEVLADGVLLGRTPLTVSRPASGGERALELRRAGYARASVRVMQESPDRLTVALERMPAPAPPKRKTAPRGLPKPDPSRVAPRAPEKPSPSEVIDPWSG